MPTTNRRTDVLTYCFVAVFVYGTVVHLLQLATGGGDPYPGAPRAIAWFFVGLVVLDPLAAALLLHRRRVGLVVANAVLVLDAAANAVVNYPPHDPSAGVTAGRIGQAAITAIASALLIATPRLWRRYR